MTSLPPQAGSDKLKRRVLSRRQFLDSSARNAAGMAAAGVGAIGLTDAAAGLSRNDPVRLGIIGLRNRGLVLAETFDALPGARIESVCDVDPHQFAPALSKLKQAHAPRVETDFRRLLDRSEIDAVVVAAPDHWHFDMAEAVLAAEKDLYLEVPVTHTLEQSRELLRRHAEFPQRIVQSGLTQRSAAHFQAAIEFLRQEQLGQVHLAKAWATHRRRSIGRSRETTVPEGVDYAAWLGPVGEQPFRANRFHHHWRWSWDFGSGELGNWGVHLLDVACWGLDVGLPRRVGSMGGTFHFDDDQETPDTQQVLYDYAGKTITWEHRQWTPHANEGRSAGVAFYGEKGTLIVDRGGWKVYGRKDGASREGRDATREHCANFLKCVATREQPAANLQTAFVSSALCHLGNAAHRERRELDVNALLNEENGSVPTS
jgi:predicted dehydrogenase